MAKDVLGTQERTANLSRGELMKERKNGRIPAVYFGDKIDSKPIWVDQVEFRNMFDENGKIFEISIDGKKKLVNTKKISYDPLRKFMWHIDFYALKKGVETTVKVPVVLVGEAAGKKEGGSVQQRQKTLEITGTPMNIPEEIEVDVSALNIGDNLHVSDIKVDGGKYKIDTDAELTVATVVPPQKAEEAEPEASEEALNPEAVEATETKDDAGAEKKEE